MNPREPGESQKVATPQSDSICLSGHRVMINYHPSSSRIGLPALSLIGRPVTGAMFSLAGSRPRAVSTVAWTSSTVVGPTGSLVPSGSVSPIAWPPRRPPPARARLKPLGQWSRPPKGLILGVRPNSPQQRTTVRSSSSRLRQVAEQGGKGGVEVLDELAVDLVIVHVRVPAVERHLDAAHADFDQPPRGQAAAAEGAVAVFGEDAGRLLRDVEGLELLGGHHHAGAGEVSRCRVA